MERGWPWHYRWLLAAAFGLAVVWPVGGVVGLSPLIVVVLAAPFVLLGRWPFRSFGQPPELNVARSGRA
jgi:hypothetical protein